ncbi:MAG: DUF2889 domain-containing protein [Desulfomonilia bacterium]
MSNLALYRNTELHTRNITSTTYRVSDDVILVEGILKDERCGEIYSVETGEKIPASTVHEISLRLLVEGPMLTVRDLEVDMTCIPHAECLQTRESLQALIGQRIAPGFTEMVRKTFGGPRGCTHLNSLLLAMAPATVQGFWTLRVSRPHTFEEAIHGLDEGYLIDTCWVWREEGDLARGIRSRHTGSHDRHPGNTPGD